MLSKRGIFIVAAVVVLATPLFSAAQSSPGFQQSEKKFTLTATGLSGGEHHNPIIPGSLNTNQFLNLEKIFRQDMSFYDIPDNEDWNYSPRLIAEYYFDAGAFVPLVGISMGYVQDDSENGRYVAGPKIGVKYFINPSTFFYGLLESQHVINDVDNVYDIFDDERFDYGVGVGLTFSY